MPSARTYLQQQGLPPEGSPDIVVAVIDTGVDYTHPDLAGSMWVNPAEFFGTPGVDDDGNGYVDDIHGARVIAGSLSGDPMDDHGHGTHVAGIIASQASKDNAGGVAPGVKIMAIKAAQYSGVLAASDIARGIIYAVDMGADIINMSFGGYARSQLEYDALVTAYGTAVLVAAAGNNARVNLPCPFGANMYPAAYNWVLGVMAHQEGYNLASFSNFDCVANDAQEYELMAPGVQVWSTLPYEGYGAWSGTSMATPVVSGLAALARTKWSDKSVYSSRFIMGQIASTGPFRETFRGRIRGADALESLTSVPTPELSYLEHWLFDTPDIDPGNDNDGIVDAGETVELAIVIRNHWGKADNVQVTLEAWAEGAVQADPYVEMLIDSVNYGAVGSFNNDDNGLLRDEDGAVIGVQNPFRFRTDSNTPNDHLIPFRLTFTAENGYDPSQPTVTSTSRFFLLVQRGRELPRIISEDMTLTKDDYWLVSDSVLIEEGAKVTVTEGTQIQFFSVDPADPYSSQARPGIQVEGGLLIEGTVEEPVEIFTGLLYEAYPVGIWPAQSGDIWISHAKVANPVLGYSVYSYNREKLKRIENVEFFQHVPDCIMEYEHWGTPPRWGSCLQHPWVWSDEIHSSIFYQLGYRLRALGLFDSSIHSSILINSYIKNITYSDPPLFATDTVFLKNYKTVIHWEWGEVRVTSRIDPVFSIHEPSYLRIAFPREYDGKTYVAVSSASTIGQTHPALQYLYEAQRFAETLGGHVVTVNDADEEQFLQDYRNDFTQEAFRSTYGSMDCGTSTQGGPRDDDCWNLFRTEFLSGLIDQDRSGLYQWLSGEPVDYVNWFSQDVSNRGVFTHLGWGSGWVKTDSVADHPIILELPGSVTEEQLEAARRQFIDDGLYGTMSNNAFLNDWWDMDINNWMRFYMRGGREHVGTLANNYWGTTSTTLIEAAIHDFHDDFNLGKVTYQPILTTAPETAYPFVVDVVVSNSDGPTQQVGAEAVTFTVTFNRDMDTDVQPTVSFGPAEPHTDFIVPGDWTDARTWVGAFAITPVTGDGYQSMRVAGAVAADDPWLVTGNDYGRFRFEVITSGAEAMNMQASGGEGHVDLWWTQDDFELLAGYNLYRSTEREGEYQRINATVVPVGLTTWRDTDVQPGQPYFYYFTVVQTDLSESDASNTATATPVDTIPPVITHSPVTQAAPGQPLTLRADVTDNVAVLSVTLYHRVLGADDYTAQAMTRTEGDRYSATLEGRLIVSPGIDYYIQASDGVSNTRSGRPDHPHQIVVEDRPVLTSITPATGPAAGGTEVAIVGSNFKAGATVTLGQAACADVERVSATRITCTTPQHFPEVVDVAVTNPDSQRGLLLRGYTYRSEVASLGLPDTGGGQNRIVEVPVSAANVQGLASASLTVAFDPDVLAVQGGSIGSLTPGWSIAVNTETSGQARISMASGGGTVSGAGVLAVLELDVLGAPGATSVLGITDIQLNAGAIPAEASPGLFTVATVYDVSGTVTYWHENRGVSDVLLNLSGDRLYAGRSAANGAFVVAGAAEGDYILTPSKGNDAGGISAYDASLVLRHDAGLITLSGHARTAGDVTRSGSPTAHDAFYILQRAANLIDLPFPGAGATWFFDPASRNYTNLGAHQNNQDFTAILLGDPSGNWGEAAPDSQQHVVRDAAGGASLSLPTATLAPGQEQSLSVVLDLAGGDLYATDIVVRYDPDVIAAMNVQPGHLAQDWLLALNVDTPGLVRVALAGAEAVRESGELLTLTVQARGQTGEESPLEFLRGDLNEGRLPGDLNAGLVRIGETEAEAIPALSPMALLLLSGLFLATIPWLRRWSWSFRP